MRGLAPKFILSFIVFFSLLTGTLLYYLLKKETELLSSELVNKGVALTKTVARVSKEFILDDRKIDLIKLSYETEKENPGILYCVILNKDGKIIGSSSEEKIGQDFVYPEGTNPISTREISVQVVGSKKKGFLDIGSAIFYGNLKIGEIHIGLSRETIVRAVQSTQKGFLFILPLFLGTGIIGVIFLVQYIIGPLKKLTEHLQTIGKGDLDIKLDTRRKDELGTIARATNDMVDSLKKAREELKEKERMRKEMELAREIQETLLPSRIPEIEGYEITAYYTPASVVSGDYYDIVTGMMGKYGIIIGDVSGKGVGSSMVMTMVKTYIYATIKNITSPKQLLIGINYFLRKLIPEDMFVTLFFLLLDKETNRIVYSTAGHNPPLFYREKEHRAEFLKISGIPVGMSFIPVEEYTKSIVEEELILEKNDVLLLYTDGLTEVMNEENVPFGEEKVREILLNCKEKNIKEIKDNLISEVDKFRDGVPRQDDLTLVLIKKR